VEHLGVRGSKRVMLKQIEQKPWKKRGFIPTSSEESSVSCSLCEVGLIKGEEFLAKLL
jgi:hypothetical protein